jgi:hypothetical protein
MRVVSRRAKRLPWQSDSPRAGARLLLVAPFFLQASIIVPPPR